MSAIEAFEHAQKLTTEIRAIRAKQNLSPKEQLSLEVTTTELLVWNQDVVEKLANVTISKATTDGPRQKFIVGTTEYAIPMEGLVDAKAEKEKLEAMFKKFSRTAEDMYDGYGSSGLGLAISKRLVDLQNGKITAKSTVGEGTEFLVYLPYTLVEHKKKTIENSKKDYEGLSGQKILCGRLAWQRKLKVVAFG